MVSKSVETISIYIYIYIEGIKATCKHVGLSVSSDMQLNRGVSGRVLTKQRLTSSCFGSAAYSSSLAPCLVSFQPVTYVLLTDIPVLSVCHSRQELSLSPNTTRLMGWGRGAGGFTVKCKNQEQIGCVSLRCLMCQQPHMGGVLVHSFIQYMYIQMLSAAEEIQEMSQQQHTLREQNNDWCAFGHFYLTVWVYDCLHLHIRG